MREVRRRLFSSAGSRVVWLGACCALAGCMDIQSASLGSHHPPASEEPNDEPSSPSSSLDDRADARAPDGGSGAHSDASPFDTSSRTPADERARLEDASTTWSGTGDAHVEAGAVDAGERGREPPGDAGTERGRDANVSPICRFEPWHCT